jgi:hypothetical protein
MRTIAFLLSVYFILFTAQSALAAVSRMKGCETSCCENKSAKHHSTKNNSEKQDNEKCPICNCNIFQCAFCSGIITEESSFRFSLFAGAAAVFPQADLHIYSSHLSDCWQPPELV